MRDVIPLLVVDDVRLAVDHYVEALGFRADFAYPPERPTFATVVYGPVQIMLESAESYARKTGQPAAQGERGLGVDLNLRFEGDLEEYYRRVCQQGATVVRPLVTSDYGISQFAVRDAGGYVVTFICHHKP